MKILKQYRLEPAVVEAIEMRAEKSGRTATKVVEDAIMRRDRLSQESIEMIEGKMSSSGWTFDEVVEWCVQNSFKANARARR